MRTVARLIALVLAATALGTAAPADAAPAVKITKVYYDPPGSDPRTNAGYNAEYVVIKNMTSTTKTLTGWTVRDAQGKSYKFGTFRLAGGKSVSLHTGSGTNSGTHVYWRQGNYVWNNTTDKATLRNASGTVIHSCGYPDTSAAYQTC